MLPNMMVLPDELLQETDTVLYELDQQKALYHEFEKKMENKIQKIELENAILKKLFAESHQKNLIMQERMERVLKTLYNVFVGNGTVGQSPVIGNGSSGNGNGANLHHFERLFSSNRLPVSPIVSIVCIAMVSHWFSVLIRVYCSPMDHLRRQDGFLLLMRVWRIIVSSSRNSNIIVLQRKILFRSKNCLIPSHCYSISPRKKASFFVSL